MNRLWSVLVLVGVFSTGMSRGDSPEDTPDIPKHRTAKVYPEGEVIISDVPLTDVVYEAQKNKFLVTLQFVDKHNSKVVHGFSIGTGFMLAPGMAITNRHLYFETCAEMKRQMASHKLHFDYEERIVGIVFMENRSIEFPLSILAVANGTRDLMLLRVDRGMLDALSPRAQDVSRERTFPEMPDTPRGLNQQERSERIPAHAGTFSESPVVEDTDIIFLRKLLLFTRTTFADAKTLDKLTISGFAPAIGPVVIDKDVMDKTKAAPAPVRVTFDLRPFNFTREVVAVIEHYESNQLGITRLYCIQLSGQRGFSGGPAFDAEGNIVGVTTLDNGNFTYIISSKDLQEFLRENKLIK